ncbi:hypothetical protein IC620_02095 [Hazenella sp. IB182357]|uniref:Uncharacterized protein n=1 Tax=Polycladospora coralii TaxID=2771432 RepID=A0A926N9R7_9BACL|nr:hypothetical protein [Polycladospora coralii]MBD1371150.1 hypothetical protein [Polycladospora coralii]MBS7530092.1 hypothetical protein [Polycladospora coralii]
MLLYYGLLTLQLFLGHTRENPLSFYYTPFVLWLAVLCISFPLLLGVTDCVYRYLSKSSSKIVEELVVYIRLAIRFSIIMASFGAVLLAGVTSSEHLDSIYFMVFVFLLSVIFFLTFFVTWNLVLSFIMIGLLWLVNIFRRTSNHRLSFIAIAFVLTLGLVVGFQYGYGWNQVHNRESWQYIGLVFTPMLYYLWVQWR